MDAEERKKLNRFSRKVSGIARKRPLNSRLAGKSQNKVPKRSNSSHASRRVTKYTDFPAEFFKSLGEINAISSLPSDGITSLQKYIFQLTNTVVQKAIRFMEQNRRGVPTVTDIDAAAELVGLTTPNCATNAELLSVKTNGRIAALGTSGKSLFVRKDEEIDVRTLLQNKSTPVLYDIALGAHWLAVDGVQPACPQNPPPEYMRKMQLISGTQVVKPPCSALNPIAVTDTAMDVGGNKSKAENDRSTNSSASLDLTSHPRALQALHVERRPQEVSHELMLYFRDITEACVGPTEVRRKDALDNVAIDTGLQPVVPYLVNFVTEGIRANITNSHLAILIYLMRLVKSMVENPNISLKAYLQDLVPVVMSCCLCKQVCQAPLTDNHWALRDFAAKQLAAICTKYNSCINGLQARVAREVFRVLYGWLKGRSACNNDASLLESIEGGEDDEEIAEVVRRELALASHTPLGQASNSLSTLYGTLTCFHELGVACMRRLLFPLLPRVTKRVAAIVKHVQEQASGVVATPPPTTTTTTTTTTTADGVSVATTTTVVMRGGDGRGATGATKETNSAVVEAKAQLSLTSKEQKSIETCLTKFATALYEWRKSRGKALTWEAYKADYGRLASCLFPRAPASAPMAGPGGIPKSLPRTPVHPGTPINHSGPAVTPAGTLIVTRPQPQPPLFSP